MLFEENVSRNGMLPNHWKKHRNCGHFCWRRARRWWTSIRQVVYY